MSIVPITECGTVDFDAVWQHYLDAGFLYPAKLANLEPLLPLIQETWPKLLAAPPEIMQLFVAGAQNTVTSSVSVVRDSTHTYIVEHAVSSGHPAEMLQCLTAVLPFTAAIPSSRYMGIYFRPNNKWPVALSKSFKENCPPHKQAEITRRYLVCPKPDRSDFNGDVLIQAHQEEIGDFLRSVIGNVLMGATGIIDAPINLDNVNSIFREVDLKRQRSVLGIRQQGKLVGVSLCYYCSALANFSSLCNRNEIHVAPTVTDRDQVVCDLARGSLNYSATIGSALPTLLVDPQDVASAVKAGWIDSGKDYTYFVWERESETGWDSAYAALKDMYDALERRKIRKGQ